MAKYKKVRTLETDLFGYDVREDYINSKEKGDRNELVLAGLISRWTGEPFARVPRSGGLRWKDAPNVCGDLACTNTKFEFAFVIETKHYKKFTILGDLRRNSQVYTIWAQVSEDSLRAGGKESMLFLRENGMPAGEYVLFLESRYLSILPVGVKIIARANSGDPSLIGVSSTQFFSQVSYTELHRFANNK